MRVIFLDFDGVLNHDTSPSLQPGGLLWSADDLDPLAIERVNQIAERAGAIVVISSSWRKHSTLEELIDMLKARGLRAEVIGMTPSLFRSADGQTRCRGDEIQAWIDEHPCSNFVILDDECDMGHLITNLVRTAAESGGLQDHHVEIAVRMLEG